MPLLQGEVTTRCSLERLCRLSGEERSRPELAELTAELIAADAGGTQESGRRPRSQNIFNKEIFPVGVTLSNYILARDHSDATGASRVSIK